MIYLFTGTDETKVRAKAFAFVAAARAKEPNLAYARLAREDVTAAALEHAASSGGLFVSRLLILIDDPFTKLRGDEAEEEVPAVAAGAGALVEEGLDVLAASDNAIILLVPGLPAARAKKLAAKAKLVYTFDRPARRDASRGFNSTLVHALAARSREKLWLEIVRALRRGDAPEMLHGLLHWKAREILEKGNARWTPQEARALSRTLIALLMHARRTGADLTNSLERFALAL